jgi:hypothetical protein
LIINRPEGLAVLLGETMPQHAQRWRFFTLARHLPKGTSSLVLPGQKALVIPERLLQLFRAK